MPKAIITNDKIEAFLKIAPTILMQMTRDANDNGVWFKAKCSVKYRQDFDIDSDKGIGGEAHVRPTQPGVTVLDGNAEAKAKISVEKSREGALWVGKELEFQSIKARANPNPNA